MDALRVTAGLGVALLGAFAISWLADLAKKTENLPGNIGSTIDDGVRATNTGVAKLKNNAARALLDKLTAFV